MARLLFQRDNSRTVCELRKTTKMARNVLGSFAGLSLLFGMAAMPKDLPDARDLVSRSLAAGERNEQPLLAYVNRTRADTKQLEPDGRIKSEEIKTFEDIQVDGLHIRKLVAKNDKPLTGSDQQKEEKRIAKLVAQRKNESPEERARRLADQKEKRDKEHRFSHELLAAFDFQIVGEEILNGRKTWLLDAAPHPGYKPKELKAQMFPHLRGKIWIDEQDLLWVKAEAFAIEAFSVGLSLLVKVDQGGHIFFEQSRLADGTWVVSKVGFRANVRLAMMKHLAIDSLSISDNYRKVPPESRVVEIKDEF